MADSRLQNLDGRPSSKALLELAAKEARGKLKVFLGMAPGVGKTYAMLAAARDAKAHGVDVVVGVVETHGRSETAALLDGLEVLARKPIEYRQQTLMEFDIDAAIARHPQLLLIDELAHTNAPGVLHTKRYQDAREAIRAGIDVWTTLNVQHLESLTDVVQRITGVTVRETVPDKVLEEADEVVLVDLPPEDLIARLKEGKVYLPDNARRAIDQFFKPGNLIALRELALRRAADRVDEQMIDDLRQRGVSGQWPTAERLLVCVGPDEFSETVVRSAARMAQALKSEWFALHLKSEAHPPISRKQTRRTEKALRLAERLGATAARIGTSDLTAEILDYAKRNNITQIVIGRSEATWVKRLLGRSLSRDLVTKANDIAVTIVAPERKAPAGWQWEWPQRLFSMNRAVLPFAAVASAVGVNFVLDRIVPAASLAMVFLLAVLSVALRAGVGSAIFASVLSFLAFNFFFIEPRWSFTVAQPHELLALLAFLVVAVITGGLAGKLAEQAAATREHARSTQTLYDFSNRLSAAATLDDVLFALANQCAGLTKGKAVVLLKNGKDLVLQQSWPPVEEISTADMAAARWCVEHAEMAGRQTGTMPAAEYQFRPLLAAKSALGTVGISTADDDDGVLSGAEPILHTVLSQASVAIERTMFSEAAAQAAAAAQGERLRSALLSSISHDLRTPLASIVGSVSGLRTLGDRMQKSERDDLLINIEEEAGRLSRFVSNLLDMTRLETGAVDIKRDWVEVGDVVRSAVERARKSFPRRPIEITVDAAIPLVRGDPILLEQVVFNLLDNADKYSPAASVTRVVVSSVATSVIVSVTDSGIGIPAADLEKVFEKFYRVQHSDGRGAGTGLGLSIAAGIVNAMGGTVKAESPVDGRAGTRMIIALPAGDTRAT